MSGEEEKGRGNVLDYEQVSRAAQGAEKEHQEQEVAEVAHLQM